MPGPVPSSAIRTRGRRLAGLAIACAAALIGSMLVAAPATAAPVPTVVQSPTSLPAAHPGHEAEEYQVLLFSKTAGFRHTAGIDAGIAAINGLATDNHFTVDATEDATAFTEANLAQYDTVVFLSTTGDVLNAAQQTAFEAYIKDGGGYFGIHSATDTEAGWPWYVDLAGATFTSHPAGTPQGRVFVEDRVHPMTAAIGDSVTINEEWYNFNRNPRANVHVLLSADTRSYTGSTMANMDHPLAWCQDSNDVTGLGRSAYTALGHDATNWGFDWFEQMILGGIQTTAGAVDADCGASLAKNYEVVALDDNTSDPMMLSVADDGRVFYIQQNGLIRVIKPDAGAPATVGQLPVITANESGLLGLELDPGFATNGFMYLFHSPVGADVDRLSRFTVDPATNQLVAGSEQVILDVPVQRAECCHHGGSMVFDEESGDLYLATGDNTNPFASDGYAPVDYRSGRASWDASRTSGNTNSLSGKVLRIHPEDDGTYAVPAGNLFAAGTADTKPEIYAMGLRNPFRIDIDPETGHVLVADYGPDAGSANPNRGPANTVEWNIVDEPGFYGWPFCTGNNQAYNRWNFATSTGGTKYECATGVNNDSPNNTGLATLPPAVEADIFYHYSPGTDWPEIGGGGAPMAGPMYRYDPTITASGAWPQYWDGKAFLAEWNRNTLYQVLTNDGVDEVLKTTATTIHTLPAPATRGIKFMDGEFGPDGSFYMIDWGGGWSNNADSGIYRIDYLAGDRAPIAKAAADVTAGTAPLTVQFSSAGSADPDGETITYQWDFDDGETSTEPNPSHTFAAGVYDVQLTVTDDGGRTGVSNLEIVSGNNRPVVEISTPLDGQFFEFGDQVSYTATVTDVEDGSTEAGTIECDLVQQQSQLGHFSGGSSHAHPMSETTGCTATIQTLEGGGHGGDVWLYWVIEVSYTDQGNGTVKALTGVDTVILQTKHRQAEHFNDTGRIAGSTSTGDPGVVVETTSDPAGGTQNIGYVEPGDWISFDRVNLTDITALSMRVAGTTGGDFEVRWNDPETGALLGTVPAEPTSGWQAFENTQTALTGVTEETGTLYLVAKNDSETGSVVNVNWVDFIGKGATVNQRPDITSASVTPLTGQAPLEVALAAAATDPEGSAVTYSWDMGTDEEETVSGPTGSFTYQTPGTYTVTLTVTDEQGSHNTRTFQVKVSPPPPSCLGAKSDEFDGTTLDATRWQVVRPDGNLVVTDGNLVIPTAPADIYDATNNAPNIVLQPMPDGAWEATTMVTGAMYTSYQQAGLVVYGDDDNYAKLVFSGRSSSGDKAARVIQFSHEQGGGAAQEANTSALGADFPDTVWLKLASDGTNLTPSYSVDGIDWVSAPTAANWSGWDAVRKSTAAFEDPRVGLLSLANNGTPVDAAFDFFHLTPDTPVGAVKSDQFDGTTLDDERWNVIRPEAGLTVSGGQLTIPIAPKDLYQTTNDAGNLVLQDMPDGAWEVVTKVTGSMYTSYEQAGILVYGDDDNYAKLVFEGRSSSGDKAARIVQFSHEQAAGAQEANSANLGADFPDTVWLKLASDGTNLTPSYSADGETWISAPDTASWSGWSTIRKSTAGFTDPQVGLVAMAGPSAGPVVDAHFDFFEMTPDSGGGSVGPDDEFDGPLSTCRWEVVRPNPAALGFADGWLELTMIPGEPGVAQNVLLQPQPAGNHWTIETTVDGTDFAGGYQQAGLIAYVDEDNFVKIDFIRDNASTRRIELRSNVDGAFVQPQPQATGITGDVIHLRLERQDNAYAGSYSTDGTTWTALSATVPNIPVASSGKVGVFAAGVNQTEPATARLDYFHVAGDEEPVDTTAPVTTASVSTADPAVVTLTATDGAGGSGVATTEYRINTQTWSTYTAPVSVPRSDVDQSMEFRSTDNAGNVEDTKSVTIGKSVDTAPPVTTAALSPTEPSGTNGWWNGPVTLTLSATDNKPGDLVTEYAFGDGVWHVYGGPVAIDVDGAQQVQFRSTDVAGNVESTRTVDVKIDTTEPEVAANLDGDDPVRVSLIASDDTSGVQSRSYKVGSGDWTSYTGPFTVAKTSAAQVVQFKAVDKAGNESELRSVTVAAAPVVLAPSVTTLAVSHTRAPYGAAVTATISVSSGGTVGAELVSLYDGATLVGAGVLKAGKAKVVLDDLAVGNHPLTARFAGNAAVAESVSVVKQLIVDKAKTSVGLKASAIKQTYGTPKPVTLTATVALDSKRPPAGQVRFKDGSTVVATVPVISGKASYKLSQTTKVGAHTYTAQFVPADSATTAGATSSGVKVTVVKAASTTTVKTSATKVKKGKSATVTATVKLTGTAQTTAGTVAFHLDGKKVKTVAVAKNIAAYKLPTTAAVGKHTVKATFVPKAAGTTTGSTSKSVTITVTK